MSGTRYDYIRDGAAIYARSFATIRAEADLSEFAPDEARIAVRIIHACGMIEITRQIRFGHGFVSAARDALRAGCPVLCDSEMVAHGITHARLPAGNPVICTLRDAATPGRARMIGNTRSAAALDLWGDRMAGALVAIGNAPTALFHLLELITAGAAPPAAIIGMPVGFVGAIESKAALAQFAYTQFAYTQFASTRLAGIPFATVLGRQGGSAMAAATVNAVASDAE